MASGSATVTATAEEESSQSKRPSNTAFKQQKLPAWQPILTAGSVLPLFFVIGVAFISIGVGLFLSSENVKEWEWDYTQCKSTKNPSQTCAEQIENQTIDQRSCNCTIEVRGDQFQQGNTQGDWEGPVYMYYGLDNFYQNHRRYVKSRDDKQLVGEAMDATVEPDSDCGDFIYGTGDKSCKQTENKTNCKPILPCGAIANSLFSDVITMKVSKNQSAAGAGGAGGAGVKTDTDITLHRKGIAWASDKQYKFRNPGNCGKTDTNCLCKQFESFSKPTEWKKPLCQLDPDDNENNGLQNEDLIVWMRTAALPNFRKLYRKLDLNLKDELENQVLDGKLSTDKDYVYTITVEYNFKVTQFSGKKKVILSTTSVLGGKNNFLGIAYIVVGVLCFLLGIVFLIIHLKYGKKILKGLVTPDKG